MTLNVIKVLDKISNDELFKNELYFVGGTALAYYLNHRVSEDIDIVSLNSLPYRDVIPAVSSYGAKKLQDENVTALRLAGLFPDEYMIKFILDDVKIEFFQANRAIQKEILLSSSFSYYEDSNLKILDLKSIAKLKIVALIMRNKSRDLFDFGAILDNQVLSLDELLELFFKIDNKTKTINELISFIDSKQEPKEDEAVYLNESNRIDLSFEEIKKRNNPKIKTLIPYKRTKNPTTITYIKQKVKDENNIWRDDFYDEFIWRE